MASKRAIEIETLNRLGESFQESRGISDKLSIEQMIELAKEKVGGGENKFAQLVDRSITGITEKDLEGVTIIGNNAFSNCKNLTNVAIPEGVTTINRAAFYECAKLTKLKLPVSLTQTEYEAFSLANAIEETYYNGEPWQWCIISRHSSMTVGNLYLKNQLFEHLVLEPTPEAYQYAGSYNVMSIKAFSFSKCKSLKTVMIKGASNRYEFKGSPSNSGLSYAFSGCENLVSVEIGTKKFGSNSSYATSLLSDIFNNCPNLTDIYVCWSEGEIGKAPWGATNATIHYNTPIRFYIGDTEYRGLVDMTFEDWVNSEYNTGGFYVNENGYIQNAEGLFVKYLTRSTGVASVPEYLNITEVYKFSLEV